MRTNAGLAPSALPRTTADERQSSSSVQGHGPRPRTTITGAIGAVCMYPLRAIIRAASPSDHPNTLPLIAIINVAAAWALATAGSARVRDHRREHLRLHRWKVATNQLQRVRRVLGFDVDPISIRAAHRRFSCTSSATDFYDRGAGPHLSIMTSYARARAVVVTSGVGSWNGPSGSCLHDRAHQSHGPVLWVIRARSRSRTASTTFLALNKCRCRRATGRRHVQPRVLLDRRPRHPAMDLW